MSNSHNTRTTSLDNGDEAGECERRDLSPALQLPITSNFGIIKSEVQVLLQTPWHEEPNSQGEVERDDEPNFALRGMTKDPGRSLRVRFDGWTFTLALRYPPRHRI